MDTEGRSTTPAIRIDRLLVEFGAVRALDSVSFDVPRGRITGLIGRNGAGKTTCIRVLAGLLDPTSVGVLEIDGSSPLHDRRSVLAHTGFLLSEPALFHYLTPRETLRYIACSYGLPMDEADARASDLIRLFDLSDAEDRLVDGFSTGMQKRLALAAALIHSPAVLVLDEPFESLDPLMVRSLKKLLRGYAAGGGTVLLSSHLIDAVEEICEFVVILEQGRLVGAGPTEAVRAGIASTLPAATLEDLYASLVPASEHPELGWLIRRDT